MQEIAPEYRIFRLSAFIVPSRGKFEVVDIINVKVTDDGYFGIHKITKYSEKFAKPDYIVINGTLQLVGPREFVPSDPPLSCRA